MAKKKWKFTDLSDDDIVQENIGKDENPNKDSFNVNINEFSEKKNNKEFDNLKEEVPKLNENIQKVEVIEKSEINNVIDSKVEAMNSTNENNDVSKIDSLNDTIKNINKKNVEIINSVSNELDNKEKNNVNNNSIEEYKSKYDIHIDYDSEIPIKQQIKQQQEIIKTSNSENKLKTFNESLNSSAQINNEEFNTSKIQQFFTTKEKLDVKTNIYLKPNLVNEIQMLSKKTGESRSAIINKLIEHALKDIKSN